MCFIKHLGTTTGSVCQEFCPQGGRAWQGGHAWEGGHVRRGHAWHGACMAGGGHAWQGGMCDGEGACVADTTRYGQ